MSPRCVWIITVGGGVDEKVPVKFPNIVMLTELGKYIFFTEFSVCKYGVSFRKILKIVLAV